MWYVNFIWNKFGQRKKKPLFKIDLLIIEIVKGFPREETFDVTDVDWFDGSLLIADDQIQCIKVRPNMFLAR